IKSPKLTQIGTGIITNLAVRQDGFSLGSFTIGQNGTATFGSYLSLSGVSLAATNFSYSTTTGAFSGSVTVTIGSIVLFPGNTTFTSSFTGVTATFNFGNGGKMEITIGSFDLSIGEALEVTASNVVITPSVSTILTIG